MRALSLSIFMTLLLAALHAPGWADVVHLYNGEHVQGKMLDVTGEIIRFKTNLVGATSFKRLELASRTDRVELRGKDALEGEILYVDPFKLEVQTSRGRVRVWRFLVQSIDFGIAARP